VRTLTRAEPHVPCGKGFDFPGSRFQFHKTQWSIARLSSIVLSMAMACKFSAALMFIHEFQHETAMQRGRDKFSGLRKHKSNWPSQDLWSEPKKQMQMQKEPRATAVRSHGQLIELSRIWVR